MSWTPLHTDIMRLLVERTREGPVESWLSRIAALVRPCGIDPAEVKWTGSPRDAAYCVVIYAESRGMLAGLREALGNKETP